MYNIFHGWRRNLGCVVLVGALALTLAWIRSYFFNDEILIPYGQSVYFASSIHARIGCGRQTPSHTSARAEWNSFNMTKMNVQDSRETCDLQTGWRWAGFRYESGTLKHQPSRIEIETWMVPYWSLALPLTLLAAYLILLKPRKQPFPPPSP